MPSYLLPPTLQFEECICTSINYSTELMTKTMLFIITFKMGPQFLAYSLSTALRFIDANILPIWKKYLKGNQQNLHSFFNYSGTSFELAFLIISSNPQVRPLCNLGINTGPSMTSSWCHFLHCQQMVSLFYGWVTRFVHLGWTHA